MTLNGIISISTLRILQHLTESEKIFHDHVAIDESCRLHDRIVLESTEVRYATSSLSEYFKTSLYLSSVRYDAIGT